MTTKKTFLLIAVGLIMEACSSDLPDAGIDETQDPVGKEEIAMKVREDIYLSATESEIIKMQSDFAFKLFGAKEKSNTSKNENTVISPLSVNLCMSMLMNGATGEAKNELKNVLCSPELSVDEVNELNLRLVNELTGVDNTVNFMSANSLWSNLGIDFQPTFVTVNNRFYKAEAYQTDLNSSESMIMINQWVAEHTKNQIKEVFSSAPGGEICLVNTIYFNGGWSTGFNTNSTTEQSFKNIDGSTGTAEMMSGSFTGIRFHKNSKYSIVSLPYGNGAFNFYAILPDASQDFGDFLQSLDAANWKTIKNEMKEQDIVSIRMPKFKISTTWNDIRKTLKDIGISKIFAGEEVLNGMCTKDIPGSSLFIKQHAALDVSEEGTEGSAATLIRMVTTSEDGNYSMKYDIDLNRPYIYIIEEISTDAIIFIGKNVKF